MLLMVGAPLVFYPMHLAGLSGMARKAPEYADYFTPFTVVGFHGSLLLMFCTLIFVGSFHIYMSNVFHRTYV